MDNQTSVPEATASPGKLAGQLVAAVILAEGIWGLLSSLTNNLVVPLLARTMEADPQSPLYLGKGEVNIPALFASVLSLCLAGMVFVLLYEWSRRKPAPARVTVVKRPSPPAAGPFSFTAPPPSVAPARNPPPPAAQIPQARTPVPQAPPPPKPAPPPVASPAQPAKPKEVYYNIVGDPINPTEDD